MNPLDRLKDASKWMWAQGDYPAVALLLEPCAVKLAGRCDIETGMRVLDVAAGTGNFAIATAGRGAEVVACDFTPHMIELGQERTQAAGLKVEWREGDAEALPFPDGAFQVVASVFGAMFAPRPERVATEMFRVCREGGPVAMANYHREGFLGSMSSLFARYSTPLPFEVPSPFEWGEPGVVRQRLGAFASSIAIEPDTLTMRFEGVDAGLDFWERTNAPTIALRATIPPERYAEFQSDARHLIRAVNSATDGSVLLTSSYVLVLART